MQNLCPFIFSLTNIYLCGKISLSNNNLERNKMTIIEFYDKVAIENIAGAMLCNADKIILVGDSKKKMEKSRAIYQSILDNRGVKATVSHMCINRNNLMNIVSVLTEIVNTDESCIFDLTGGEDLYLVAVGIIMNKFEGKIQCHRFNFINNTLNDCDADGNVCSTLPFIISVDENIGMYGGRIVRDANQPLHTYGWNIDDDFSRDIELMWEVCKRNTGLWNLNTGILGSLCEKLESEEQLDFDLDRSAIMPELEKKKIGFGEYVDFLAEISQLGLIYLRKINDGIAFNFKNAQTKRCLTLPGQILELIIASRMKQVLDADGSPLYHDVTVGAVIDWDQNDEANRYRTINEIDILAMKGAIPIFISCKNGNFDENELYKLSTVADRFGDKYAKKVLVATKLDKFGVKSDYLRARMNDMNIRCIENITTANHSQFEAILRSLWFN